MMHMAIRHSFKCGVCGYQIYASGGPDCLMHAYTTSIVCTACRRVMDVETHGAGRGSHAPSEDGIGRAPRCPLEPAHEVMLWGRPYPCPECGATMDRDPSDFMLAD